MRSGWDGAGSGVQWNCQTLASPPLTTPKRSAAPSRWLMRGLDRVWPGSSLGGATPLNRGWSVGILCSHTPSTLHSTFLPDAIYRRLSSGNCSPLWESKCSVDVSKKIHIFSVFRNRFLISLLIDYFMFEDTWIEPETKQRGDINYKCSVYSLCLKFTLCVCVSLCVCLWWGDSAGKH